MIVSHSRRFVFVRARKVGGTSLETALAAICGPEDIVTPEMPPDEAHRLTFGIRSRNYSRQPVEDAYISAVLAADGHYPVDLRTPRGRFRKHMSLARIEAKLPLAGYRCVGVVRSPYGMVVSMANFRLLIEDYRQRGGAMRAERAEILRTVDEGFDNGDVRKLVLSDYYRSAQGHRVELLRQERLAEDAAAFGRSLGVTLALPEAKLGLALSDAEARAVLRPDQVRRVCDMFDEDFEAFGYSR